MGNGPFIDGLPINVKMGMFHSYVKLPEGKVFKLSRNS
jgi:3-dehydroquinate synthase class II